MYIYIYIYLYVYIYIHICVFICMHMLERWQSKPSKLASLRPNGRCPLAREVSSFLARCEGLRPETPHLCLDRIFGSSPATIMIVMVSI